MAETAAEAVQGADLIILCCARWGYGRGYGGHCRSYRAWGHGQRCWVGKKRAVITAVTPHLPPHAHFVPAHPLAGTEHSGPTAGFAELFDNRWCLITPTEGSQDTRDPIAKLTQFWVSLGARVDTMDPDHHDLVLAVTSHAPHLIAYTHGRRGR